MARHTEFSSLSHERSPIPVWDWVVRVGHGLLAASFLTAYVTAESESLRLVHTTSGLIALAVVLFRIVWGFTGPEPARFSRFLTPPSHAIRYLQRLFGPSPEHHTGHNPAGGWAVVALLALGGFCAATGLLIYNDVGGHWTEEAHELLANAALALVVVHVIAVFVSSYLHRENLLKPMLSGIKLGYPEESIGKGRGRFAVVLLLVWAGVLAWWLR
jgi:cytochrome b